jgi:putative transposase
MSKTTQATFGDIHAARGPATTEETVTKTLVCRMQTSRTKNAKLHRAIGEWQAMAGHMADLMPSYDEWQWGTKARKDQRLKRDFSESSLYAAVRNEAAYKVCESFESWESNGKQGNAPVFGDDSYIRLRADYVDIERSDGNYGVRLGVLSGEKVWWGLTVGDYQRDVLDAIVDGEVRGGSAEAHLHNDGTAMLHLNYTVPVNIYQKPDLDRWVGVDLGEAKMWVASPVEGSEPIGPATFDQHSDEFRKNREHLSREGDRLREQGDLNAEKARRQRRNYTDTMTHTASCTIADLAAEYAPCGIAIEDLTGYRKAAEDPIHDWPYNQLQEKIIYKANERGLPVRKVDAHGTSTECWKCGTDETAERDDREWLVCDRCGDRRHADVNAAINIGKRAQEGA